MRHTLFSNKTKCTHTNTQTHTPTHTHTRTRTRTYTRALYRVSSPTMVTTPTSAAVDFSSVPAFAKPPVRVSLFVSFFSFFFSLLFFVPFPLVLRKFILVRSADPRENKQTKKPINEKTSVVRCVGLRGSCELSNFDYSPIARVKYVLFM